MRQLAPAATDPHLSLRRRRRNCLIGFDKSVLLNIIYKYFVLLNVKEHTLAVWAPMVTPDQHPELPLAQQGGVFVPMVILRF